MKIAAVVIDKWKLEIFKRHLLAGAYTYTVEDGPYFDTLTLRVSYAWVHLLQPIVAAANLECAKVGPPPKGG